MLFVIHIYTPSVYIFSVKVIVVSRSGVIKNIQFVNFFLKMPKRRCVFAPNLKSEFPFLKDADEVGKEFVQYVNRYFL